MKKKKQNHEKQREIIYSPHVIFLAEEKVPVAFTIVFVSFVVYDMRRADVHNLFFPFRVELNRNA